MKFSVPTNWHNDLLAEIERPEIDEVYGKLDADFVGGGRSSYLLPPVSAKQAQLHIQQIHKKGIRFNYLLNAPCLDNKEFTISGQRKLHKLIHWLLDINVDVVTVSIPYLLQMIKKQYPQLKIYVSTIANVNTIQRAKLWQDLGADSITLSDTESNRDFVLLEKIRKAVNCQLQLIANNGCLYQCPLRNYHYNSIGHASQSGHRLRGFIINYCLFVCRGRMIVNPVEFIRSGWIRPEDIHYYEKIGIDSVKLAGRFLSTQAISTIVKAYAARKYKGNLVDLIGHFAPGIATQRASLLRRLRYFFRPSLVNIFRLNKLSQYPIRVYIDNQALEGFIEHFFKADCSLKDCQDCKYCAKIAQEVIKIEPEHQEEMSLRYKKALNEITSSRAFKYLSHKTGDGDEDSHFWKR